jgi:nucleoid DNA-binding protein/cell division protein FtsN
MIKQEVIEKISKYFKLTQFEAEKIYDDIFSIIMHGVKEDNIADVTNLGEFIIKYNNGKTNGGAEEPNSYKKTVEFLASTSMEEDLNQQAQDYKSQQPFTNIKSQDEPQTYGEKQVHQESQDSIEDEFRKKREALLNKISIHPLQDEASHKAPSQIPEKPEVKPIISAEPEKEIIPEKVEEPVHEPEDKYEEPEPSAPVEKEDAASQKSFSDYFTEIKNVPSPEEEKGETVYYQEPPNVIPKSAVELHNEITHPHDEPAAETIQNTAAPVVVENSEELIEHKLDDNSYYIWYRDSEANVSETQTMSYEYELLYQATKEAEYKSKLKIYVSTFILFFSIVLILLIFSPVIYKVFFTPAEGMQKTEEQQNNQNNQSNNGTSDQQNNQNNVQQPVTQTQQPADTNKPVQQQTEQQNVQQTQTQQPPQQNVQQQQNQQPVTKQEPPKQEQPKQENAGQNNEPKLDGVVKNTMGYSDEKFKVIYVKLDNGKFTIQESAWDSDAKANKRISTVDAFKINGMKGSVLKVDLGDKGVWFRARFGEFASVEEARVKAEELRNKERIRLQAALVCFLFFT